jgi:LmbE family N-acetylglucosaminyl deacetylase
MNEVVADSGAFDTSILGTPECFWAVLEPPVWSPPAGPIVVVAPHPDDETLGAGGLIHTWAARHGLPVVIVSVTDGEAACPEIPKLAAVRRSELEAALSELASAGIDLVHLQLPDGAVSHHQQELAAALSDLTPDGSTIIAPFEHDGHPDHDAVGRIAREVADSHDAIFAQYPIWAWHRATPAIFASHALGSFMLSPAAQRAKQNAIRRYRSQVSDRPGGAIVPAHVLEYFARPYEVFVL